MLILGKVSSPDPCQNGDQDQGADDHMGAVKARQQEKGGAVDACLQGDPVMNIGLPVLDA